MKFQNFGRGGRSSWKEFRDLIQKLNHRDRTCNNLTKLPNFSCQYHKLSLFYRVISLSLRFRNTGKVASCISTIENERSRGEQKCLSLYRTIGDNRQNVVRTTMKVHAICVTFTGLRISRLYTAERRVYFY